MRHYLLDCEGMESHGVQQMLPIEPLGATHPYPKASLFCMALSLPSKTDYFWSSLSSLRVSASVMCVNRSYRCSKIPCSQRKLLNTSMFPCFFVNVLFVLPGTPSQNRETSPTFSPPLLSGLGASRAFLAEE